MNDRESRGEGHRQRGSIEYLDVPGSSDRLALRFDDPPSAAPGRPAMLYLHGFGASQDGEKAEFFRSRALAAGFAFCSFDFRGHGLSGGTLGGISLERNLEDVALVHDFLARQGHPRPVVLGSSFGGLTGLWHTALHSDRVEAGLFIAPAVDLGERTAAWAGETGLEEWRRTGHRRVVTPVVDCELGWSFVAAFERYPTGELAARLSTRCLLLQGRLDDQVSWNRVVDFSAACQKAKIELHLFSDGDHRLVDRKPLLWRLMGTFLDLAD